MIHTTKIKFNLNEIRGSTSYYTLLTIVERVLNYIGLGASVIFLSILFVSPSFEFGVAGTISHITYAVFVYAVLMLGIHVAKELILWRNTFESFTSDLYLMILICILTILALVPFGLERLGLVNELQNLLVIGAKIDTSAISSFSLILGLIFCFLFSAALKNIRSPKNLARILTLPVLIAVVLDPQDEVKTIANIGLLVLLFGIFEGLYRLAKSSDTTFVFGAEILSYILFVLTDFSFGFGSNDLLGSNFVLGAILFAIPLYALFGIEYLGRFGRYAIGIFAIKATLLILQNPNTQIWATQLIVISTTIIIGIWKYKKNLSELLTDLFSLNLKPTDIPKYIFVIIFMSQILALISILLVGKVNTSELFGLSQNLVFFVTECQKTTTCSPIYGSYRFAYAEIEISTLIEFFGRYGLIGLASVGIMVTLTIWKMYTYFVKAGFNREFIIAAFLSLEAIVSMAFFSTISTNQMYVIWTMIAIYSSFVYSTRHKYIPASHKSFEFIQNFEYPTSYIAEILRIAGLVGVVYLGIRLITVFGQLF